MKYCGNRLPTDMVFCHCFGLSALILHFINIDNQELAVLIGIDAKKEEREVACICINKNGFMKKPWA